MPGMRVLGNGSAVPSTVITNDQLAQKIDTSDEWIRSRTGIGERRVVSPVGDALGSLAVEAAEKALLTAQVPASQVDLIILASSTPDDLFGSAGQIQRRLGATGAVAFDLTAACSGFVFGLITAAQFIRMGVYRNVLLIGADALSRWVDWNDRRTCILFGDGAGAVVLQASEPDQLLGFAMASDGKGHDLLTLPYDPDRSGFAPVCMNGKEVYRFAVTKVPEIIEQVLEQAGLSANQVDWYILHQANQRIMDAVADRLGVPPTKMVSNIASVGNSSAASIPIALDQWIRSGKIVAGQTVMTIGFGAGLSWGAALFTWG